MLNGITNFLMEALNETSIDFEIVSVGLKSIKAEITFVLE